MPDIYESALPVVSSIGTGDYIRTVYNDSGTLTSALITKANLLASVDKPYACIVDQKTQNTDGGTATNGAWRTRDLNTELSDDSSIVSISSNQFTLIAGTYIIRASAPGHQVARHQARLWNVTDAALILTGTSSYAAPSTGVGHSRTEVVGKFTIGTSKALEIQHRVETTVAGNGFGEGCNFGVEIYTVVELWKVT